MSKIKRDVYLNKIIARRENGLIKIVTGIRRCGKSYLLDPIYKDYLIENGVKEDHIIKIDLDERRNNKYLDPDVLDEYIMYGGLPRILSYNTKEQKSEYLKNLFEQTYLKDIIEKNNVQRIDVLDIIVNILASSVGLLTNPHKLYNTFQSNNIQDVSVNTITSYINYLLDAFLIEKAERYDVKGKKYISTPSKYYFTDIGLRNCRLNFRQQEESHIMENILYNELLYRGYNVDVGVVEIREGDAKKQIEVDFVCNQFYKRYYIQSVLSLPTREKTIQEERPLMNIPDNFKKIIVVKDKIRPWMTEEGISVIGLQEFLLNIDSLDL